MRKVFVEVDLKSSKFRGPFKVIDVEDVNCTIKLGRKIFRVHANRLKVYY